MTNNKQTVMTNKNLNSFAKRVVKPQKPSAWNYRGATAYLDRNRAGIAKLRQRGFTWGQIANTLERLNIPVNYNNLYQWQLRTFRQKSKNRVIG